MKNKKIALLTLLTFFGITILIIPQAKALHLTYEQRTNPSNPFLFSVDMIYVTSDGDLRTNVGQYYYHQVFLEANKYYLFYDPVGYMTMEGERLWIHSAISTLIDYYYEYVSESGVLGYILYINPSETGLYNITIRSDFGGVRGFSGIGVLEIPIVPLDTEMSSDYWDFYRDSIMAGIIELDSQVKYQTGHDGQHHGYLGMGTIYYANINLLSSAGCTKLDRSYDIMDYDALDIITTNDLGQGAGKYIFYSLSYGFFSLMEAEPSPTVSGNVPLIRTIIIIGAVIGVCIVILVFAYKRYKRNE